MFFKATESIEVYEIQVPHFFNSTVDTYVMLPTGLAYYTVHKNLSRSASVRPLLIRIFILASVRDGDDPSLSFNVSKAL